MNYIKISILENMLKSLQNSEVLQIPVTLIKQLHNQTIHALSQIQTTLRLMQEKYGADIFCPPISHLCRVPYETDR